MAKKDKPLPQPPQSPFGTRRFSEEHAPGNDLLFDRMAKAQADGTLNEFLGQELPDSVHGRKLTELMMHFMGMTPSHHVSGDCENQKGAVDRTAKKKTESCVHNPPEDVQQAVRSGDVKRLMELLHREHKKRMPDSTAELSLEKNEQRSQNTSSDTRDLLDQMISIAAEQKVSQEWLLMRALRLYIDAYIRTGRL